MRTVDPKEEQLFLRAIEIQSRMERIAFLDHQCASDAHLRFRIEKLLRLHDSDDSILDETIHLSSAKPLAEPESELGTSLGNYRLVRRIGVGGMGVVYLAEQLRPVQRRVALKIIKLGMDTRSVIGRFETERQALALMEHPSITKVYDAGATPSGRPYFVMELVNGPSITEYCDQNRLRIDERLELFSQVCNAVQHAHQKGVIHRDLKPSNILVTERDGIPVPKIIDFGIAKATSRQQPTEESTITEHTVMVGTPEYMSPEQADMSGMDLDTKTDIYSLGAVFYELCTGTSPLKDELSKKSLPLVREIIQTRLPQKPSLRMDGYADDAMLEICQKRSANARTLTRMMRGDIDWISQKCLSKDRTLRYETAADLSREIERYLIGDPVEAAAPTLWYRTAKFAQKHRKLFAFSAIMVAMLSICLFVSIKAMVNSERLTTRARKAETIAQQRIDELDRARQSFEFERTKITRSERNWSNLHRDAINKLAIARAIARFNGWVAESRRNDPSIVLYEVRISNWLRQELGDQATVIVGENVMERVGSNDSRTSSDDVILLSLILEEQRIGFGATGFIVAKTLDWLGESLLAMGHPEQAIDYLRESLMIRTEQAPQSLDRVKTMIWLARCLIKSEKTLEAQSYLEAARKRLDESAADDRAAKDSLRVQIERELDRF